MRATEPARLSGQHKQSAGTLIDERETLGCVEHRPDPSDRRAKPICPTGRGLARLRTADAIMADPQDRRARRVGREYYARFKRLFTDIADITRHHRGAARVRRGVTPHRGARSPATRSPASRRAS
ncbi:hypothetical protein OHS18_17155 [Amycolatopsis sp. NBC_00355]|uniref:hypothetical protein n=1 Tax=Amycolatopsis sp. NBC_00355 TaxID=2975957 RepID=UPI002E27136E